MGVSVMSLCVCLQMVTTQPANEHPIKQCVQRDYTHEQVLAPPKHTEKGVEETGTQGLLLLTCLAQKEGAKKKLALHFSTVRLTAFSPSPSLEPAQYPIR